ncbi:MAG: hypothetical protein WD512_06475 [Candidatus Paceibacterota bacterium]
MANFFKDFLWSNKQIKFLLVIALTLLCLNLVLFLSNIFVNNSEIPTIISASSDIAQVIFFIVIGLVTVLSYLQARKSLFTPIKTEIFKMQIQTFEEVLSFFTNQSETDFTKKFDFDFIVDSNSTLLFADFIHVFYKDEIKLNEENLRDLHQKFAGTIISQSWAEKNFMKVDYLDQSEKPEEKKLESQEQKMKEWEEYEYGTIHYSKKFETELDKLNDLISSPLIPNDLKDELVKFEKIVMDNLSLVGETLNEIKNELPEKFSEPDLINKFDRSGVWNLYNEKQKPFEPQSKIVLTYIRDYLKIDSLIE